MVNASRIELPDAPTQQRADAVRAWREDVAIDTYLPRAPDRYPAYLDARVYQGSSGQVYPLPFHERISQEKVSRSWDAIHLENEWVRLMILPELGGRVHVGIDKTRDYDFFYRNNVIKPALVGLAGPWVSGGVELNWPQHHRPATFLPTAASIEHEPDGAVTVWCSDHDPFARMKGMHGFRLRPDSSVIELRARLYNRSEHEQTFMWWANVAAHANDDYQSFFPTDVHHVADHAKRAVSSFPSADGRYYGVDYPAQVTPGTPDGDRIDWYRNVPVPTSYMCLGTSDDFFGGYDHGVGAGFVHWADHRVAPGKKQWTWGNAPFGLAWDAHLTDGDGPYVELMAGVYTDNQPDFTFLRPGETRTFSQYWFPIQDIGPAHQASLDAAVHLDVVRSASGGEVRLGVAVTAPRDGVTVTVTGPGGARLATMDADLGPGRSLVRTISTDLPLDPTEVEVLVEHRGTTLVRWRPRRVTGDAVLPDPATEPPAPAEIGSADELHATGLHLSQYRHATRSPEPYWEEALRRDPDDARAHVALAARSCRAGRYADARTHLEAALGRLTLRNPNPRDGEAHYLLGQVLARTGHEEAARDAFGKAAWDASWRSPGRLALARLEACDGNDAAALAETAEVLAVDPQNLQARAVRVLVLRRAGRHGEAAVLLDESRRLDGLDWWLRFLDDGALPTHPPTALDVALELVSVGELAAAARVLDHTASLPVHVGDVNVAPLALLHLADVALRRGDVVAAAAAVERAQQARARWCLASRLDDADMLARIVEAFPWAARAWALLGHWGYAVGRRDEAVTWWETSVALDGTDPVVHRNLAVAAYNVLGDAQAAAARYERAIALAPDDARLRYERDQLAGRTGAPAASRIEALLARPDLVHERDDLTIVLIELLVSVGRLDEALALFDDRSFQPWEGGEGQALGAWEHVRAALARRALTTGDLDGALTHVEAALEVPAALGEARHLLANASDLHLLLGDVRAARGEHGAARTAWEEAARFEGDFQTMEVRAYSEKTYASVLAWRRLGREDRADALIEGLAEHVAHLAVTPAQVDYFATSLPTMLLFTDDPQVRQDGTLLLLRAQLAALEGADAEALTLLRTVLDADPLDAAGCGLRDSLSPEHVA
ncbi:DUF5107 domain-containing protein [Oerskovia enterophila]|uniref:Tetratricopeptide repeat protein n=1 Tax=Oerskovia enterophila TaxID=43678 RepID=A0A161XGS7_9CELL|nr:DUF5107 domain-containing protein [Oerskovia enterophila]KZM36017.1 tetratricopeptide repeat protein [Oerskovia enterophila]